MQVSTPDPMKIKTLVPSATVKAPGSTFDYYTIPWALNKVDGCQVRLENQEAMFTKDSETTKVGRDGRYHEYTAVGRNVVPGDDTPGYRYMLRCPISPNLSTSGIRSHKAVPKWRIVVEKTLSFGCHPQQVSQDKIHRKHHVNAAAVAARRAPVQTARPASLARQGPLVTIATNALR